MQKANIGGGGVEGKKVGKRIRIQIYGQAAGWRKEVKELWVLKKVFRVGGEGEMRK
jgi:hypothetical protein